VISRITIKNSGICYVSELDSFVFGIVCKCLKELDPIKSDRTLATICLKPPSSESTATKRISSKTLIIPAIRATSNMYRMIVTNGTRDFLKSLDGLSFKYHHESKQRKGLSEKSQFY